ncbi:uncharacterized protein LOC111903671 isoform X2 [Lactuca sativa]|uniref:uncharacterized protein LOC111903671 isoform X2 n=1 Tax=Lactuca sativa TaxID=4236 RepID=UPI0022AED1E6|nr:uncharacterized protein LOC111903671 isoform X2 [Lactuca sativa]
MGIQEEVHNSRYEEEVHNLGIQDEVHDSRRRRWSIVTIPNHLYLYCWCPTKALKSISIARSSSLVDIVLAFQGNNIDDILRERKVKGCELLH